jgi:hypothetical protein
MSTLISNVNVMTYSGTLFNQVYNSCASNALYAVVYKQTAQAGDAREISVYQNYADSRIAAGTFYQDAGTGSLGNLMSLIMGKQKGLAEASVWSNSDWRMYMTPTQDVYDNAAQFKIVSYRSLGESMAPSAYKKAIETELSHGKSVLTILDSLEGSGRHAVVIEGMNNDGYIFKNSWGDGWGNDGYGTLSYAQSLKFKGLYVIDEYTGLDFKWTATRETIAKLYHVILDRCVERDGLIFWSKHADNGLSMSTIAEAMINSQEAQALNGVQTNAEFAKELYFDAIGREARDVDVTFFDGVLQTGMNRGVLTAHFVDLVSKGLDTKEADMRLDNIANISVNYALTYQNNSVNEYAQTVLDTITHDQSSVQIVLIGMQHFQEVV